MSGSVTCSVKSWIISVAKNLGTASFALLPVVFRFYLQDDIYDKTQSDAESS